MTPTLARMVAAKRRELSYPLRWFSIPNLFRYEQPQKGRMREHWQLNADIFGIKSAQAEKEILNLGYRLMKNFGANDSDFIIRINDRRIINSLYEKFELTEEDKKKEISRLIDKKNKLSKEDFIKNISSLFGDETKALEFIEVLESREKLVSLLGKENPDIINLTTLLNDLEKLGITNAVFDATLMRGLDYYTGIVFEIFDTDPENSKALFGGGRYDNLLEIFGSEKVPAVGFGFGDVRLADFLTTHNLIPTPASKTHLYIAVLDSQFAEAERLADELRNAEINVLVDFTEKSLGDQIKKAVSAKIPYLVVVGSGEVESKKIKIKNLETREEAEFAITDCEGISNLIKPKTN
jgi:histidyl-tRNA synthetase